MSKTEAVKTICMPIGPQFGVTVKSVMFEATNEPGGIAVADGNIVIDVARFIKNTDDFDTAAFIAALTKEMAASDFIDAVLQADSDDRQMKESDCDDRGIAILDAFVEVARRLDRLPDDYESDEMRRFDEATDRLYDAIVEGRRDDAIDILKSVTGGYLRSVAEQRNLFPERIP